MPGQLYAPRAYYARCERYGERTGEIPISLGPRDKLYLLRLLVRMGIQSRRRRLFWRLLRRAWKGPPHVLTWAAIKALQGEHMIRHTERLLVPRLDRAIEDVARERQDAPALARAP